MVASMVAACLLAMGEPACDFGFDAVDLRDLPPSLRFQDLPEPPIRSQVIVLTQRRPLDVVVEDRWHTARFSSDRQPQPGDLVHRLDGRLILSLDDYQNAVTAAAANRPIIVEIYRLNRGNSTRMFWQRKPMKLFKLRDVRQLVAPAGSPGRPLATSSSFIFQALDRNLDGLVDTEERRAIGDVMPKRDFVAARLDGDGDGRLSFAEYCPPLVADTSADCFWQVYIGMPGEDVTKLLGQVSVTQTYRQKVPVRQNSSVMPFRSVETGPAMQLCTWLAADPRETRQLEYLHGKVHRIVSKR